LVFMKKTVQKLQVAWVGCLLTPIVFTSRPTTFIWNVTRPMFQTLHLMFETQYNELALAVDLLVERIRALGFPAPATYSEFARLSSIKETAGVPKAEEMIKLLVEGQESVIRTARSIFALVEKANDEATADLLTQRIQLHEKTAWMLRSLLED
jgi:starvation-inducible DNA-binding protein